ncbi:alpha/beta fold hydrolase [Streptococcus pneumoniae]|nr:alpha/beta fold hydrolase [Streptococcus pneumoniae]
MQFQTSQAISISFHIMGSGFPILFLHGNGLSKQYFKRQTPLSDHFQLIFMDSRSHGKSTSSPTDFTFQEMADDIEELLDYLAIRGCLIVGHSDGANLAMVYAHKYPKRIAGLLLNGGNLNMDGLFWPARLGIKLEQYFFKILKNIWPTYTDKYRVAQLLSSNLPFDSNTFAQASYPVLVLVGQFDLIKPSHSKEMAELFPIHHFKIIPWTSHNIAPFHPKRFNQLIQDFYTEQLTHQDFKIMF